MSIGETEKGQVRAVRGLPAEVQASGDLQALKVRNMTGEYDHSAANVY